MNFFKLFLILAVIGLLSCKSNTKTQSETAEINIPVEKYEVKIEGMTCTGCEQTIQSAVNSLEGVKSTTASHVDGQAIVEVEEGKYDSIAIKKKIEETGYTYLGFNTSSE